MFKLGTITLQSCNVLIKFQRFMPFVVMEDDFDIFLET